MQTGQLARAATGVEDVTVCDSARRVEQAASKPERETFQHSFAYKVDAGLGAVDQAARVSDVLSAPLTILTFDGA